MTAVPDDSRPAARPPAPLPDRYDPRQAEDIWYGVWEERGYFRADPFSKAKPYCIVIPPPNVTGSLHIGHALNNTLQDILVRWKRMEGFNVLWQPGTDHAGIATQVVVERQLAEEGLTREAVGRDAFVQRVWKWKEESGGTILRQLRRLGASCDWERERFTMDPGLSAAVREVFVRLWEEGLIYRGDYIVNWCPRCRTVLSDLEVEYEERAAQLFYIKYGPVSLATVRPETKLGDTALAVHPKDRRYAHYVGKEIEVRSVEGTIRMKVVADAAVDPKFGTGVIKVTPAHDPADFEIGRRHGLEVRQVIGFDGRMNELAGKYAGLDRFEARKRIVEDMTALASSSASSPTSTGSEPATAARRSSSPSCPSSGTSARSRSPSGRSRPSATGGPASPPGAGRRRTTPGSTTSGTGASRASYGGATGSPSGTATRRGRCTCLVKT